MPNCAVSKLYQISFQIKQSSNCTPNAITNAIYPKNLIDEFLVNDGPKRDCLLHICEYLSVEDLIRLCEFSQHTELFVELLNERFALSTKLFDFTKIEHKQKAFQYFGHQMRKVKVCHPKHGLQMLNSKVIIISNNSFVL